MHLEWCLISKSRITILIQSNNLWNVEGRVKYIINYMPLYETIVYIYIWSFLKTFDNQVCWPGIERRAQSVCLIEIKVLNIVIGNRYIACGVYNYLKYNLKLRSKTSWFYICINTVYILIFFIVKNNQINSAKVF